MAESRTSSFSADRKIPNNTLSQQYSIPSLSVDESERFKKVECKDSKVLNENETEIPRKMEKNCRCSRSKCLKLYCCCFRINRRCEKECICVGCMNDGNHERERSIAVRNVKLNSSSALKGSSFAAISKPSTSPGGSERLYKSCRCKKSRCRKKVRSKCQFFSTNLIFSLL